MTTKKHRNGGALLPAIIGAALISGTLMVWLNVIPNIQEQGTIAKNQQVAESYVIELSEFFRSRSLPELLSSPVSKFPLCEKINYRDFTSSDPKSVPYPDPVADLSSGGFSGGVFAQRIYTLRAFDLTNMTERTDLCGNKLESIPALSPNEKLIVDIEVLWHRKGIPRRSFASVISGEASPIAVPPSVDIKADGQDVAIVLPSCKGSATISWTSSETTSCIVSPNNWTDLNSSGISTGPLTANTEYKIRCSTTTGGFVTDSVQVTFAKAFPEDGHLIFATSIFYNGNLGGISGGDTICQSRAIAGGLRTQTKWKAILSSSSENAKSHISITGPVYNLSTCGTKLVDNSTQFWSSTYTWPNGINSTELLTSAATPGCDTVNGLSGHGSHVWTGTTVSGSGSGQYCSNWTSSDGFSTGGTGGTMDGSVPDRMSDGSHGTHFCNTQQRLFCISNQGAPVSSSCTGTFFFSDNNEIRTLINSFAEFTPMTSLDSPRNDAATRQKICKLKGLEQVLSFTDKSYSSCFDNRVGYWDDSSGDFLYTGACSTGGRYLQTLRCGCL